MVLGSASNGRRGVSPIGWHNRDDDHESVDDFVPCPTRAELQAMGISTVGYYSNEDIANGLARPELDSVLRLHDLNNGQGPIGGELGRIWNRCEICFDSPDNRDDIRRCTQCFASACKECFSGWLTSKIFSGFAYAETLRCISCPEPVSHEEVRELCGKRTYRKLLYFLSRAEHRDNKATMWCSADGCWLLLSTTAGVVPTKKSALRSLFPLREKQEAQPSTKAISCEECVSERGISEPLHFFSHEQLLL